MRTLFITLPLLFATAAAEARETPECQVRIIRPVTDDRGQSLTAGQITLADFWDKTNAGLVYCEVHGACVPHLTGGRETARLIDCHVAVPNTDGGNWLDPDPKVMGVALARQVLARRRAEMRLSKLGFSNADSGGLAEAYAATPASHDGRLVAQLLAGSPAALARLRAQVAPR